MNQLRQFIIAKLKQEPLHANEIADEISGVFGVNHDNRQIRGIINGMEKKKGINDELLDARDNHYIISGNYGYKLVDLLNPDNEPAIEKYEAKELAAAFTLLTKVYKLRRNRGKLLNMTIDDFIDNEYNKFEEAEDEDQSFF